MKKALVFLAPGFEEVETITIVDVLRRGNVAVDLVSITDELLLTGSHDIAIRADKRLSEINDLSHYDALITPGGLPGSTNLAADTRVLDAMKQANTDKRIVASICASPLVLEAAGLTHGRRGTSFPGMKDKINFEDYRDELVVTDDNLITSRGPASALLFSLELLKKLKGDAVYNEVRNALLIPQLQDQIHQY